MASLPIKQISNKLEIKLRDDIISSVDLMLKLNEELQTSKLPDKIEQLKSRIEHSDNKINQLVYQLYGLTDVETKIIESN